MVDPVYPATIDPGTTYVGIFPCDQVTVTVNGVQVLADVDPLPGGGVRVTIDGGDIECADHGPSTVVVTCRPNGPSYTTIIHCP